MTDEAMFEDLCRACGDPRPCDCERADTEPPAAFISLDTSTPSAEPCAEKSYGSLNFAAYPTIVVPPPPPDGGIPLPVCSCGATITSGAYTSVLLWPRAEMLRAREEWGPGTRVILACGTCRRDHAVNEQAWRREHWGE